MHKVLCHFVRWRYLPPTLPRACQKYPQLVQETRLKKGLAQEVKDGHNQQVETYQEDVKTGRRPSVDNPDDNLFVTCPRMRLMNFDQSHGSLDNLVTCPSEEPDPNYLANANGTAITAAFAVPELACRKELVRSPTIRWCSLFSLNEFMPAIFRLGLVLATWQKCHAAPVGILLNCAVLTNMVVGALLQLYTRWKLIKETSTSVPKVVEASKKVGQGHGRRRACAFHPDRDRLIRG
ncbi:unnamed protein product [Ectocarpus sp. CCAP 1310/34]|nr:unnamed protein product [Ectocarpus sp. CCAP 1310/34]